MKGYGGPPRYRMRKLSVSGLVVRRRWNVLFVMYMLLDVVLRFSRVELARIGRVTR